jgi:nicotinate-nucleotide pyrophosphorylase (carboxylating)
MPSSLLTPAVLALIDLALEEDLGRGDVTTSSIFEGDGGPVTGIFLAKQPLVVFGLEVAAQVMSQVSPGIRFAPRVPDGSRVADRTVIADVTGSAAAVLAAERTALNFLQRLSGVATIASRFAEAVAGTSARVVDTRKTTPGWRALEKAAVRAGGCFNHRFDLGSGILIKDNHIAACGGDVRAAVSRASARAPHPLRIEVEVTSLAQLEDALAAGADVFLLDNMSLQDMEQGIKMVHGKGKLVEISGGINLDTVGAIARLGPDIISAGALTHSAKAVDISLDFTA